MRRPDGRRCWPRRARSRMRSWVHESMAMRDRFDTSRAATWSACPASRSADSVARFFGVMQAGGCPCFIEPRPHGRGPCWPGRTRSAWSGSCSTTSRNPWRPTWSTAACGSTSRRTCSASRASRRAPRSSPESVRPADLAMMQFTSGSTGRPKGALLTHGNLLRHAAGIIERTRLTAADRLLHVMPLHHTNGVNNQLVAPFLAGATVVLAERFQAEDVEDRIAAHGVHLPDRRADDVLAAATASARPGAAALAAIPPLRVGAHRGAPARGGRSRLRRAAGSCPTGCPRPRAPQR